jgi:hypothetical protein
MIRVVVDIEVPPFGIPCQSKSRSASRRIIGAVGRCEGVRS